MNSGLKKTENHPVKVTREVSPEPNRNGEIEYVLIRVGADSATYGTYMKVVLSVAEAEHVRDRLSELLQLGPAL